MNRILSLILAMACLAATLVMAACTRTAAGAQPSSVQAYVFRDVALLDPGRESLGPRTDVLIRDGRIVRVGQVGPDAVPPDAMEIDGRGRVLMPGLIDMHVHVFDEADLAANLVHGVTTVRNLGGMPVHLPMAREIEAGHIAGPRLITTGPIINERGGRNANALQVLIDGPDEARAEVQRQYGRGFRHLKVYSNLSRESFAAILAEARRLGMSVSGHPVEGTETDPLDIDATLAAGMATIEHVESIVWHGLNDDPDPVGMRTLARRFAEAGATVSPTLMVHGNLARIVETRGGHLDRADMAGFNPVVRGFESDTYAFWSTYIHEDRTRMQHVYEAFTQALYEARVRMVVGTDAGIMATPHGVSVIEEMEALVRAGLSPVDALAAATLNPAAVLGEAGRTGCVAVGCRADLVLLAADPRSDFQLLREPAGVMAAGHWYHAEALDDLRDASFEPSVWRTRWRLAMHLVRR